MICVSLANIPFNEFFPQVRNFEMIEFRIDLLDYTSKEYQQIIDTGITTIATYREEDTKKKFDALERLINMGVTYVDIELDSEISYIKKISKAINNLACKSIFSYHNFEKTPDIKYLQKIIDKAQKLSAHYTKIVCYANNKQDVARVLSLYEENNKIIAFNMGEIGKISRITSLFLGADFTYASYSKNKITAEGQYTYQELNSLNQIIKDIQ